MSAFTHPPSLLRRGQDGGAEGDPPASLQGGLEAIREACRRLSERHRLAMPAPMVRERVHALAGMADALLQDRVIEICFLLDQHGELRYNELRRCLGTISTRTLALKLAMLQEQGYVEHAASEHNPLHVVYRLSPRGRGLTDLLFPMLVHVAGGAGPGGSGA